MPFPGDARNTTFVNCVAGQQPSQDSKVHGLVSVHPKTPAGYPGTGSDTIGITDSLSISCRVVRRSREMTSSMQQYRCSNTTVQSA